MGKSGGAARSPARGAAERKATRPAPDGRATPNITPRGTTGSGGRSPALKAALAKSERHIVNSLREEAHVFDAQGNLLLAKTGTAHRVSFTDAQVARMAGATFTHNHHYTDGLTMEDGRFAAYNGLAEMRVVDARYTYSLRPSTKVNWSADHWDKVIQPAWNRHRDAVYREIVQQTRRTGQTPEELGVRQWHMVWERVARETGLRYQWSAAPKPAPAPPSASTPRKSRAKKGQ